jgi:hypothetical protein
LVEHFLGKEEVIGSIPIASSDHQRNSLTISGVERRERHHYFRMLDLQASQLQCNEEQEETDGKSGVQEVLPLVQQAYAPQRDEVKKSGWSDPLFGVSRIVVPAWQGFLRQ